MTAAKAGDVEIVRALLAGRARASRCAPLHRHRDAGVATSGYGAAAVVAAGPRESRRPEREGRLVRTDRADVGGSRRSRGRRAAADRGRRERRRALAAHRRARVELRTPRGRLRLSADSEGPAHRAAPRGARGQPRRRAGFDRKRRRPRRGRRRRHERADLRDAQWPSRRDGRAAQAGADPNVADSLRPNGVIRRRGPQFASTRRRAPTAAAPPHHAGGHREARARQGRRSERRARGKRCRTTPPRRTRAIRSWTRARRRCFAPRCPATSRS